MTFTIQCGNRRCKQGSEPFPLASRVVVCTHCGSGQRVRVVQGNNAYRMTLAPLEPPSDKRQQAKRCGVLMAGWR